MVADGTLLGIGARLGPAHVATSSSNTPDPQAARPALISCSIGFKWISLRQLS